MASDLVLVLDTILRSLVFLLFTIASYRHFIIPKPEPLGMRLIRFSSLAAWVTNVFSAFLSLGSDHSTSLTLTSFIFALISFSIFRCALLSTRSSRLQIAYSEGAASELVTTGPFAYIRHPFYASYILFWWSWAVTLQTYGSLIFAFVLTLQYLVGMRVEERSLMSVFGSDYMKYRSRTSALIPRIW